MQINLYHAEDRIVAFTLSEDEVTHVRAWICSDFDELDLDRVELDVCKHENPLAFDDLINYLLNEDDFEEVPSESFHTFGFFKELGRERN